MNHNDNIAFNTIKLTSTRDSSSKKTGALLVEGGIGCKKNINSTSLICDCLLNKKSAIFQNDIIICGKINVDILLPSDKNECKYIGSGEKRYTDIYSNNIDTNDMYVNNTIVSTTVKTNYLTVNNGAYIGENYDDYIMINVDNENNSIEMNSELFTIKNNEDTCFQIDNKAIYINNLLKLKYQLLDILIEDFDLYPTASIIIIRNICNCNIKITLHTRKSIVSNEELDDGTYVKIYNKSEANLITINCINIYTGCNIGFLLHNNEWIVLEHTNMQQNICNQISSDNSCYSDGVCDDDSTSCFGVQNSSSIRYEPDKHRNRIIRKLKSKNKSCPIPNVVNCNDDLPEDYCSDYSESKNIEHQDNIKPECCKDNNENCENSEKFSIGKKFSLNDSTSFDI